jgi:tetratricopeptide (TPR) repeat protein
MPPTPTTTSETFFRKKAELAEAIGHYRRALEGSPDHAEAHFQLGKALLEQKQPAEARTHLQAAARLGLPSVE